jgi:hypothetical protein
MPVPVYRRQFDAFLSHAHRNKVFVDRLHTWLTKHASFEIWYDAHDMRPGGRIVLELAKAVQACRSLILVASKEAVESGYVQDEYTAAMDERNDTKEEFRVIPLRLDAADVRGLVLPGTSWIDVDSAGLSADSAAKILRAFYPYPERPPASPDRLRDVYVSASWRDTDYRSALAVSRELVKHGFRLVGDSKYQKGFSGDRVDRLMDSCGAFVSIIPFRNEEHASLDSEPYMYLLQEVDLARKLKLPMRVVVDPRVKCDMDLRHEWLRMDTNADSCPEEVAGSIASLWGDYEEPRRPHRILFSAHGKAPAALSGSLVRQTIERVTSMHTIACCDDPRSRSPAMVESMIKESLVVLCDLSGADGQFFDLDVSVQAGMARPLGANLEVLAARAGDPSSFMLRDFLTYADEAEQLAIIHKVVLPYRRRIIDAELNWRP